MNKRIFWKFFGCFTGILVLLIAAIAIFLVPFNGFNNTMQLESLDQYTGGRKNVLVMGTDESGLRSDVIMIASFSPDGGAINVTSVPRDTRVTIGGRNQKINAALSIGGEEMAVQTIKEATGIPIHDFMKVNFNAVKQIVDKVGGVEFDVPQDMDYEDPAQDLYIHLKAGVQTLNGDQAVQLLRFRKYPMADIQRTKVQRDFMHAAFEQKAKPRYIFKIPAILNAIDKNMVTSITSKEALEYVFMVKNKSSEGFNSLEIPYYLSNPYVVIKSDEMATMVNEYFK